MRHRPSSPSRHFAVIHRPHCTGRRRHHCSPHHRELHPVPPHLHASICRLPKRAASPGPGLLGSVIRSDSSELGGCRRELSVQVKRSSPRECEQSSICVFYGSGEVLLRQRGQLAGQSVEECSHREAVTILVTRQGLCHSKHDMCRSNEL